MSTPQHSWWPFVRNMIKRRPERLGKDTKGNALKELEAVELAIKQTKALPDGESRIRLMELVYWARYKYTLPGAAMQIPISYGTARRWNYEFFLTVAKAYGLYNGDQ